MNMETAKEIVENGIKKEIDNKEFDSYNKYLSFIIFSFLLPAIIGICLLPLWAYFIVKIVTVLALTNASLRFIKILITIYHRSFIKDYIEEKKK